MSEQVRKILYTGAGNSPPRAHPVVTISAAKLKSIRLRVVGPRGRVHQLTVKQVAGPSVAFAVELLDSRLPYHGAAAPDEVELASDVLSSGTIELFRVLDRQQAAAGGVVDVRSAPGVPFVNNDQMSETENQPFLYLTIIPSEAGATTSWDAALTCTRQAG